MRILHQFPPSGISLGSEDLKRLPPIGHKEFALCQRRNEILTRLDDTWKIRSDAAYCAATFGSRFFGLIILVIRGGK